MSIFDKFKEWKNARWLRKLQEGINMLADTNKINFDPRFALKLDTGNNTEDFTRRICEYQIWFMGNSRLIRRMYLMTNKRETMNYFWFKAPSNARMLHCGIPGLISKKMGTILFASGFQPLIQVLDKDGKKDVEKTEPAQAIVDTIVKEANLPDNFKCGAQNESWGGHLFAKWSHDISLKKFPIFETADIKRGRATKERGITTAITFAYWYDSGKEHYRMDEVYTTNADGDALIRYELYNVKNNGEQTRVALDTIPEGQAVMFSTDEDGNQKQILNDDGEFVYTGIKGMLAFDKPNMTPSHEFPDSPYGASDYEGNMDSFDGLDEAYSRLIAELRENMTKRYIPKNMVPTWYNEDTGKMEPLLPDDFVNNYVQVEGDNDQNAKNEIKIQVIPDKSESDLIKYRTALTTAINNTGLSPVALGITGLESVNAAADSQIERNKATLETRSQKLKLWKPFSEQVIRMGIQLYNWMIRQGLVKPENENWIDLTNEKIDVDIEFGDYIIERISEKITTWGAAKTARVASTHEAIRQIHPDWDKDQVDEEVNLIRFEDGMSLDNPNNLPDLTGFVDPKKQEEERLAKEAEDKVKEEEEAKKKQDSEENQV